MNSAKDYYYKDLSKLISKIVPKKTKTLIVQERKGKLYFKKSGLFEYLILKNNIGDLRDIQASFLSLKKHCKDNTRLVITYYNHIWEPLLKLASFLGWRKLTQEQNWLSNRDIENLLDLSGFDVITSQKRFLMPFNIPVLSEIVNRWIAPLPLINSLCLTTFVVAKPKETKLKNLTVSIIIPARNEEKNIPGIISQIPKFGKSQEIIFVEGHSKDMTWKAINKEAKIKHSKRLKIRVFKQDGIGKANAVRIGFKHATGDLLMILDADLTVRPQDLIKFYNAYVEGYGDFINGSRMVYPMEKYAMKNLNRIGNRLFSCAFSWILGQRFEDTLCGTKVISKKSYLNIIKRNNIFGKLDPFGDFELIFGAIKQNLKVVEIPVRYKERVYGSTNINRIRNGLLLFKMTWLSFKYFRAW